MGGLRIRLWLWGISSPVSPAVRGGKNDTVYAMHITIVYSR